MISTNFTNKLSKHPKLIAIGIAISVLLFPLALIFIAPTSIETDQSFCPFKLVSGFPCPGCGITKSIYFLYKGDFIKSIRYHLFGPFLVLFCALLILIYSIELASTKEFKKPFFFRLRFAYFTGGILALYHTIRLILFIRSHNLDEILKESIWK